jgi:2-octaprenyl-6-methoxyphenol hydroxylase
MKSDIQVFDIIIAGGGLAGMLAALSLAQLKKTNGVQLRLAIVEAVVSSTDTSVQAHSQASAFDARVLALSHASMGFLKSLSLWDELQFLVAPIKQIDISDRGYYGKARIDANSLQLPALGYVIEMASLARVLRAALDKQTYITWFCPDTIEDISWQSDKVSVALLSQQTLQANLLIASDGAQSVCRQFAKIDSNTKTYEQSAIIANVTMNRPHANRAFERFTESGPIALLPLLDPEQDNFSNQDIASSQDHPHRCSLVWTLTPSRAKQISKLTDDEFASAFEQAFGCWLGSVNRVGKRSLFPLKLVQAKQQVHHRMVLVGNASHTLHPIAGQGFNLGLRDVEQLAQFIQQRLANQQSYASLGQLSEYQAQRKSDHQQVIALTDSLVTLFSNQLPPLVAGRNMSLKVLNYLSPLKAAFADKTMGY